MTKRGEDPLLSSEENNADPVDPPSELELNHAFTRKMSHLLCVVSGNRPGRRHDSCLLTVAKDESNIQVQGPLGSSTRKPANVKRRRDPEEIRECQ